MEHVIVNAETGEVTRVPLTEEEIAAREAATEPPPSPNTIARDALREAGWSDQQIEALFTLAGALK